MPRSHHLLAHGSSVRRFRLTQEAAGKCAAVHTRRKSLKCSSDITCPRGDSGRIAAEGAAKKGREGRNPRSEAAIVAGFGPLVARDEQQSQAAVSSLDD